MENLAPYAVAVALSPMPIAALLLILLSKRAKINSITFLLGWLIGVSSLVILSMYFALSSGGSGGESLIHKIINGVLGVFLVFLAVKEFRSRPKKGQEPQIPKWMSAIDNFSPVVAFGVGAGLAFLNFKNTPLGVAAGVTLSEYATTTYEFVAGLAFFVLLGSVTLIVPVCAFLLFGKKLEHEFQVLKDWFLHNNATVLFVLFLILGVLLISKAFN